MHRDRLSYLVPDELLVGAEEATLRLLNTLVDGELLTNVVALKAALQVYLLENEVNVLALAQFYQEGEVPASPSSNPEEYKKITENAINEIARKYKFPESWTDERIVLRPPEIRREKADD